MPTMKKIGDSEVPVYSEDEKAAQIIESDRILADAHRRLDEARRQYALAVVQDEARHAWALVSCVLGSAILIAVAVMILNGADFNPRRVVAALAVGWLVLVPWSFIPAINPPWRK